MYFEKHPETNFWPDSRDSEQWAETVRTHATSFARNYIDLPPCREKEERTEKRIGLARIDWSPGSVMEAVRGHPSMEIFSRSRIHADLTGSTLVSV